MTGLYFFPAAAAANADFCLPVSGCRLVAADLRAVLLPSSGQPAAIQLPSGRRPAGRLTAVQRPTCGHPVVIQLPSYGHPVVVRSPSCGHRPGRGVFRCFYPYLESGCATEGRQR